MRNYRLGNTEPRTTWATNETHDGYVIYAELVEYFNPRNLTVATLYVYCITKTGKAVGYSYGISEYEVMNKVSSFFTVTSDIAPLMVKKIRQTFVKESLSNLILTEEQRWEAIKKGNITDFQPTVTLNEETKCRRYTL